ncbi:MAG: carbohydrate kinase family protein [bacterium]
MDIVVTGSIAFDYLMTFKGEFSQHLIAEKLDSISVSFLVDNLNKRRGGCAANISYNLALLKERPILFGTAGLDFEDYKADLDNMGVDTTHTKIFHDAYTSSFFANSDRKGNQIASFYMGAMKYTKELSLEKFKDNGSVMIIIAPNDPEAMIHFVAQCKEYKLAYVFDPGQQIVQLDGEALQEGIKGATIFILNDYEFEMFKKKTDMSDKDIYSEVENLIVTRGEKGADIFHTGKKIHIPIAKVTKHGDPTGVGDAFRAGLLKGLCSSLSWEQAGRLGSLAAAYVLEADGPQSHTYTLEEFLERYKENFGGSKSVVDALRG